MLLLGSVAKMLGSGAGVKLRDLSSSKRPVDVINSRLIQVLESLIVVITFLNYFRE